MHINIRRSVLAISILLAFTTAIQAGDTGEKKPKILILTARDIKREHHISNLVGAAGMMQKPFKMSELREKIKQLLD